MGRIKLFNKLKSSPLDSGSVASVKFFDETGKNKLKIKKAKIKTDIISALEYFLSFPITANIATDIISVIDKPVSFLLKTSPDDKLLINSLGDKLLLQSLDTVIIDSVDPVRWASQSPFDGTIAIYGEGFAPTSQMKIEGSARATTFISENELQGVLLQADAHSPYGLKEITVTPASNAVYIEAVDNNKSIMSVQIVDNGFAPSFHVTDIQWNDNVYGSGWVSYYDNINFYADPHGIWTGTGWDSVDNGGSDEVYLTAPALLAGSVYNFNINFRPTQYRVFFTGGSEITLRWRDADGDWHDEAQPYSSGEIINMNFSQ